MVGKPLIGVLAMQGAFREHCRLIEQCGAAAKEIRRPEELAAAAGLIIPGGESTVIGSLMTQFKLDTAVKTYAQSGKPIYGTCAGMILLAKHIAGNTQPHLSLMDITVRRNAFGRQTESFETQLSIPQLGSKPIPAVFIRAPYIEQAAPSVNILARLNDKIVFARQDNILVSAFHPELTDDSRIHAYFIDMALQAGNKRFL